MKALALYAAALLLVGLAVAHSSLGERYLLMRLFRRSPLPPLFGSADYTRRTLRFAWHLTSVMWLGFAALLLLSAHAPIAAASLGRVTATVFVAHGAIALLGSRGRHYSWVAFFAIALLAGLALHQG